MAENIEYEKHMEDLWALAGEIGSLGESDTRYDYVYRKLSEALDMAETHGLIRYVSKGDEDGN